MFLYVYACVVIYLILCGYSQVRASVAVGNVGVDQLYGVASRQCALLLRADIGRGKCQSNVLRRKSINNIKNDRECLTAD